MEVIKKAYQQEAENEEGEVSPREVGHNIYILALQVDHCIIKILLWKNVFFMTATDYFYFVSNTWFEEILIIWITFEHNNQSINSQ